MQTVKVHFLSSNKICSTQFITAITVQQAISLLTTAVKKHANLCMCKLATNKQVSVYNSSNNVYTTHCIQI